MTINSSCVSNSNEEAMNTATLLFKNNHDDLSISNIRQILMLIKIVEKQNKRLEYMERELENVLSEL